MNYRVFFKLRLIGIAASTLWQWNQLGIKMFLLSVVWFPVSPSDVWRRENQKHLLLGNYVRSINFSFNRTSLKTVYIAHLWILKWLPLSKFFSQQSGVSNSTPRSLTKIPFQSQIKDMFSEFSCILSQWFTKLSNS